MIFRSEFRRRLERLYGVLGRALYEDGMGHAEFYGNLFPYLWSVLSYLWSFPKDKDILVNSSKKVFYRRK